MHRILEVRVDDAPFLDTICDAQASLLEEYGAKVETMSLAGIPSAQWVEAIGGASVTPTHVLVRGGDAWLAALDAWPRAAIISDLCTNVPIKRVPITKASKVRFICYSTEAADLLKQAGARRITRLAPFIPNKAILRESPTSEVPTKGVGVLRGYGALEVLSRVYHMRQNQHVALSILTSMKHVGTVSTESDLESMLMSDILIMPLGGQDFGGPEATIQVAAAMGRPIIFPPRAAFSENYPGLMEFGASVGEPGTYAAQVRRFLERVGAGELTVDVRFDPAPFLNAMIGG